MKPRLSNDYIPSERMNRRAGEIHPLAQRNIKEVFNYRPELWLEKDYVENLGGEAVDPLLTLVFGLNL